MKVFINGVEADPLERSAGVYEVTYSNKNRLPRKLKKELNKSHQVQIKIINDWIKQ